MQILFSKNTLLIITLVFLLSVVWFFVYFSKDENPIENKIEEEIVEEDTDIKFSVIGKTVEGRNIESYKFGNGEKHIALIGGIHGGYEWNSVLLAYEFIDYFTENPGIIPDNITVDIIPVANPDGLFKVTGKTGRFTFSDISFSESVLAEGRFNANGVDLNRNFDCNWKPESTWRSRVVSAGTEVFSEPEAKTIKDFIYTTKPSAVVFWHSQANTIYASGCNNNFLPETLKIMNEYSLASGYKAATTFDAYEVTGDAGDWLSTIGIPSITVELQNHESIDWEKNLSGVMAIFDHFDK